MSGRRIVSLLPAASEIVFMLGLSESLVGITHECNYPAGVASKPHVVRSAVDFAGMGPAEIDRVVAEKMGRGMSLYEIDESILAELSPDLIITQNLCQVCAPSGNELSRALNFLPKQPHIVWCSPSSIAEIKQNILDIGQACGRAEKAGELVAEMNARIAAIAETVKESPAIPRVFFLEWVDPPYSAGHWVPEMIEIAGGVPLLGRKHEDSVRISWEEIVAAEPDIVIVSPCGYNLDGANQQAERIRADSEWQQLSAVVAGRVFPVDADAYFARPGPRIVEGVELLDRIFRSVC